MKGLREDTNALLETQNAMLDTMAIMLTDFRAVRASHRQEHDDPQRFRGNYAIDATRRVAASIAVELIRHRGAIDVQVVRRLTRDELQEEVPSKGV